MQTTLPNKSATAGISIIPLDKIIKSIKTVGVVRIRIYSGVGSKGGTSIMTVCETPPMAMDNDNTPSILTAVNPNCVSYCYRNWFLFISKLYTNHLLYLGTSLRNIVKYILYTYIPCFRFIADRPGLLSILWRNNFPPKVQSVTKRTTSNSSSNKNQAIPARREHLIPPAICSTFS